MNKTDENISKTKEDESTEQDKKFKSESSEFYNDMFGIFQFTVFIMASMLVEDISKDIYSNVGGLYNLIPFSFIFLCLYFTDRSFKSLLKKSNYLLLIAIEIPLFIYTLSFVNKFINPESSNPLLYYSSLTLTIISTIYLVFNHLKSVFDKRKYKYSKDYLFLFSLLYLVPLVIYNIAIDFYDSPDIMGVKFISIIISIAYVSYLPTFVINFKDNYEQYLANKSSEDNIKKSLKEKIYSKYKHVEGELVGFVMLITVIASSYDMATLLVKKYYNRTYFLSASFILLINVLIYYLSRVKFNKIISATIFIIITPLSFIALYMFNSSYILFGGTPEIFIISYISSIVIATVLTYRYLKAIFILNGDSYSELYLRLLASRYIIVAVLDITIFVTAHNEVVSYLAIYTILLLLIAQFFIFRKIVNIDSNIEGKD